MRLLVLLLLLAGCGPRDVQLAVPEVGDASSLALSTRTVLDTDAISLRVYDLTDTPLRLTFEDPYGSPLEVAALLYSDSLAKLELRPGTIEVPPEPDPAGRPLPFERGFATVLDDDVADWSALDAVPEWLSQVRLPPLGCPELEVESERFASAGDRADSMASDGQIAMVTTRGSGRDARYFAVSASEVTEIDPQVGADFEPLDVAVRLDGRFLLAGVRGDATELWIGAPAGGFTRTATLGRRLFDLRLEVGRDPADEDAVYLVDELGEVLRYEGAGAGAGGRWSQLRPPTQVDRAGRDRFNVAWVSAGVVVVLGPLIAGAPEGRYLDLVSASGGGSVVRTDVGSDLSMFTVEFVEGFGTLAGSYTGAVFRLEGESWTEIVSNEIYDLAVVSMVPFRGELAIGGSAGRFIFGGCVAATGPVSLTRLVTVGEGLVSANVELNQDPVLTRIR